MKSYLVSVMMHTRRLGSEQEGAWLVGQMSNLLKGKDGQANAGFVEFSAPAKDPAVAAEGWMFAVVTVCIKTPALPPDLERRLLDWRNGADPRESRVDVFELPEVIVDARFWHELGKNQVDAVVRLKEHFPWNKRLMRARA